VVWVAAIVVEGRNAVVGNGVGDFEMEFKMILVCQDDKCDGGPTSLIA
jgi:hypothetical protein